MLLHLMDHNDNELVAEIDETVYRGLLQTKDGKDLANAVREAYTVVDDDPRRSAIDNTDAFFSFNDVYQGFLSAAELLQELDE
jgi:hypothetical protein